MGYFARRVAAWGFSRITSAIHPRALVFAVVLFLVGLISVRRTV